MVGSSDRPGPILSAGDRALLDAARTATLATLDADGRPRLVPICLVVEATADVIWSPLDEKPKTIDDPHGLARVRDILARPQVDLLVQRWSEDWTELAWLRLAGGAVLAEPAEVPAGIVDALRARYPQYAEHDLPHRPMLRIAIERARRWSAAG